MASVEFMFNDEKSLIRIDSETGTATQTVSLAERPSGLAFGYGAVWIASHAAGTVTEILE